MGFWGIEVKPGKPYPYHSVNVPGRLHVTQATLGLGSAKEKTIVQCTIGHKNPIFLCSLLPNKFETCSLNLEFDDDLVAFSVIGPQSVHLSGYFEPFEDESIDDDYESDPFGEDIADSESGSSEFGDSDEYPDESDDEFIEDDDDLMLPSSPTRKSGVIIEEIEDEEKPINGNPKSKKQKKKNQPSEAQNQIVVRGDSGVNVLESEDEDGFPTKHNSESLKEQKPKVKQTDHKTEETKKEITQDGDVSAKLKRKVEDINEEARSEKKKKNKKNKKLKEQAVDGSPDLKKTDDDSDEIQSEDENMETQAEQIRTENQSSEKKKKKKNKKKSKVDEDGSSANQTVSATEDQKKPTLGSEQKKSNSKAPKPITHSNGLVIEDLEMGQPGGKRASRGSSVSVCYTGKLMKTGKIFDSNVGRAPFKFRLGTGQVIKGWDVGVNGMRVGDKRRITIPPEMGYGNKNAGPIPANSWLVFDVELKNVR